ncbi:metalloregulator ArsR/SmtB family transcription factor [Serpentinicella sp. ANB-PHB4]|uniref:ArsR/SmtB family transcription factor n=1 Tax=Serpentinicella sp. ANB-PHB4 TaxID=3074076 RepID=UPI002861DFFE|nr:metalloregulator ArsR/SmtB family transcription factor [Serpentinicella sp. ANB-PHB4]MDR5659836.1 metalloregulator ArsR/SmtB family transcription factor [Serpentinicella sp. ANB-PHB4]
MDELTHLFKTLSDETRMRILVLLYHKELCVCQLQGILEAPQPKISKHLSKLKDKGFVKDTRQEQFIFYYLNKENKFIQELLENIILSIQDNPVLKNDVDRLGLSDTFINAQKQKKTK